MRVPGTKRGRQETSAVVSARLSGHVALEAHENGKIVAWFDGFSAGLGTFSEEVADLAQQLRTGLALDSFAPDSEIHHLVERLARHGLLEYCLAHTDDGEDLVVIEPQIAAYWPGTPRLDNADVLVLSRFAYMRRRGDALVLESPRAGALFKICDPKIAAAVALLSTPQQVEQLRQDDFPAVELLALLLDCQILFKIETAGNNGLRADEGDDNLVLWDFHDLLFHTRSTEGRHANPLGGVYPYAGDITPLPAVRRRWPGRKTELDKVSDVHSEVLSPFEKLLRERHSTRDFDDERPITFAELSRFLDSIARVLAKWKSRVDLGGGGGPMFTYAARPYPAGGASYELELYLAVNHCEGLARGFYHYDAGGHALVAIGAQTEELHALLTGAELAMGAPAKPQILITIAARFGRVSWKYSSIAYSLILKDVGVLMQTFYLMATDMGLGGCAIGTANIEHFAKMTGIEFHVEGPVGQFAMGRGSISEVSG